MNQFKLSYIYTWKCHNETPYIVILNIQKCHHFVFFLNKNREQEGKTGPVWGLVPVGRERIQGKGSEGEYHGNIHICIWKNEKKIHGI
jgi:hypothetical protein